MNGERLGLDGERPENGKPKRRKPNRTPPSAAGPGGLQGLVNWILDNTDPVTGVCFFPPDKLERAIRYIHPDYGPGGPQSRLRGYLTPGLRRAGVDPLPPRAAR
jgi:hypothetical protein